MIDTVLSHELLSPSYEDLLRVKWLGLAIRDVSPSLCQPLSSMMLPLVFVFAFVFFVGLCFVWF